MPAAAGLDVAPPNTYVLVVSVHDVLRLTADPAISTTRSAARSISGPPIEVPLPDDDQPQRGSSPVCFLDEVDPSYAGYLSADEVVQTLVALRADEAALTALAQALAPEAPALARLGDAYAADAAATGLALDQLGLASTVQPRFVHPLDSEPTLEQLIARAHAVCGKLRAVLPKIASDRLHATLKQALARHEERLADLSRD